MEEDGERIFFSDEVNASTGDGTSLRVDVVSSLGDQELLRGGQGQDASSAGGVNGP